ncbi:uncharacterized protein EURHEDRAFT_281133 [Aspergillus ruber CBS 135680]|uniref:Transmembrane protein n=1 Tax=Aspergillus ruber (strain CBS 135680) TaxID=1388766 RepID=A0A017S3L0_ASPRC|nr:uncharacterized protein EURHEDRAFT_281133 [Aspergillus ruber CBS 135680]EYE90775.1 hypothetical protein EURHEDRAFT_281133 [Aspergillus ruber CBS 135680]
MLAQGKSAGLITRRSSDRNRDMLMTFYPFLRFFFFFLSFFSFLFFFFCGGGWCILAWGVGGGIRRVRVWCSRGEATRRTELNTDG